MAMFIAASLAETIVLNLLFGVPLYLFLILLFLDMFIFWAAIAFPEFGSFLVWFWYGVFALFKKGK